MNYLLFAAGLGLVIFCSNVFVDSAIWMAKTFRIPQIIIGATLVSLCTTLPEAVISVTSSAKGLYDMAFGNVLGSISFNTAVIMAMTFVLVAPQIANRSSFLKSVSILLGLLAVLLFFVSYFGVISRVTGFFLLLCLVFYLVYNTKECLQCEYLDEEPEEKKSVKGILLNSSLLILGAAGIVFGSDMMVDYGEKIALSLGVSKMIIGLTLTGVGCSMPELATAIASIAKKAHNISVGNVIGANILNVTLVIGASAATSPIKIDRIDGVFHVVSLIVFVLPLLFMGIFRKNNFKRFDGFLLLAFYSIYMYYSILYFS